MKITNLRAINWQSFVDTGDVELEKINVLVGRNNSGKSALLRAVLLMQQSNYVSDAVRLGEAAGEIKVTLGGKSLHTGMERHFRRGVDADLKEVTLIQKLQGASVIGQTVGATPSRSFDAFGDSFTPSEIPNIEPRNFIYTYLSKRKVLNFGRQIDRDRTNAVNENLENLIAKIDRLANTDYVGSAEYTELCTRVLGFRVSTYASNGGHQAGISVGRFDHIPIEDMGEGVSNLLGLITNLCMADGNLFLIEEPENDIHPVALKALLDVIIEKSRTNQFIVSTHSNIVTRYLGAAESSKLFSVTSEFEPHKAPTSTIREVDNDPESRIAVLRELGYELSDFYLWDAWLILEESSAQTFIQYLIQWFVPSLMRIRIVSASGIDNVEPMLREYRRLFLFAHLEPHYKNRTWAIVDGDEAGARVVKSLKRELGSWPEDRFQALKEKNFEYYYPPQFRDEADAALALRDKAKRDAKKQLLIKVDQWCKDNPDEAKAAFEQSAAEVITILKEVEASLADL